MTTSTSPSGPPSSPSRVLSPSLSTATTVRRAGVSGGARRRLRPLTVVRFTAVLVGALVVFGPVYISVLSAVSTNGGIARSGLLPRPGDLTAANLRTAATAIPLAREYLVSVMVVAIQTFGELVSGALAAYALVYPRWRGRRVVFALVVATMAVPGESLVIPNYELVSDLGLRNTVVGVVAPYLAAGYVVFLLRQAFAGLPVEIWEAARIDGAGDLRTLFAVIVPACRPQVTTAVMWAALAAWNGFFWPLLITDTDTARTVQVDVSQLAASEASTPAVLFAGTVLVVAPTALLVIAAQRFLVTGLARGLTR